MASKSGVLATNAGLEAANVFGGRAATTGVEVEMVFDSRAAGGSFGVVGKADAEDGTPKSAPSGVLTMLEGLRVEANSEGETWVNVCDVPGLAEGKLVEASET